MFEITGIILIEKEWTTKENRDVIIVSKIRIVINQEVSSKKKLNKCKSIIILRS